jgi:hypothetical protein
MDASFQTWSNGAINFVGMRHKTSGAKHGIVREIDTGKNTIKEASYKDGVRHGLYRMFRNGVCQIIFYKNEEKQAVLSYNMKFKEKMREDEKGLISEMKTDDWVRPLEKVATDVEMSHVIEEA